MRILSLILTNDICYFFTEICIFLFGEGNEPEVPLHVGEHKLRQTLIERCDHLSDEVSGNNKINTGLCFWNNKGKCCNFTLKNGIK